MHTTILFKGQSCRKQCLQLCERHEGNRKVNRKTNWDETSHHEQFQEEGLNSPSKILNLPFHWRNQKFCRQMGQRTSCKKWIALVISKTRKKLKKSGKCCRSWICFVVWIMRKKKCFLQIKSEFVFNYMECAQSKTKCFLPVNSEVPTHRVSPHNKICPITKYWHIGWDKILSAFSILCDCFKTGNLLQSMPKYDLRKKVLHEKKNRT